MADLEANSLDDSTYGEISRQMHAASGSFSSHIVLLMDLNMDPRKVPG